MDNKTNKGTQMVSTYKGNGVVSFNVAKAWSNRAKNELSEEEYKDWRKTFINSYIVYKTFSDGIRYCSSTSWVLNQIDKEGE
jgi:hypothetical protein